MKRQKLGEQENRKLFKYEVKYKDRSTKAEAENDLRERKDLKKSTS